MDLPELNDITTPEMQFEMIKRAAEAGNVTSMLELAKLYEQGIGTPVNKEAANLWRNKAGLKH
ncbi:MAG: hypothetical protein MJ159_04540 [Treponemataceae bacterium]|nr:hypothetical protein [Treponemataceae bacterium]